MLETILSSASTLKTSVINNPVAGVAGIAIVGTIVMYKRGWLGWLFSIIINPIRSNFASRNSRVDVAAQDREDMRIAAQVMRRDSETFSALREPQPVREEISLEIRRSPSPKPEREEQVPEGRPTTGSSAAAAAQPKPSGASMTAPESSDSSSSSASASAERERFTTSPVEEQSKTARDVSYGADQVGATREAVNASADAPGDEVQALASCAHNVQKDVDALGKRVEAVSAEVGDTEKETTLAYDVHQAHTAVGELSDKIDEANIQAGAVKDDLGVSDQVGSIAHGVREAHGKVDALGSALDTVSEEVGAPEKAGTLADDIHHVHGNTRALDITVQGVAAGADKACGNMGEVNNGILKAGGRVRTVSEEADQAHKKIGTVSTAIDEVGGRVRTVSEGADQAHKKMGAASAAIDEAGGRVRTVSEEADQAHKKMGAVSTAIDEAGGTVRKVSEEAGQAREGLEAVSTSIGHAGDEVNGLARAASEARRKVDAVSDQVGEPEEEGTLAHGAHQANEQVSELNDRLSKFETAFRGLRAQVESLDSQMSEVVGLLRNLSASSASAATPSQPGRKVADQRAEQSRRPLPPMPGRETPKRGLQPAQSPQPAQAAASPAREPSPPVRARVTSPRLAPPSARPADHTVHTLNAVSGRGAVPLSTNGFPAVEREAEESQTTPGSSTAASLPQTSSPSSSSSASAAAFRPRIARVNKADDDDDRFSTGESNAGQSSERETLVRMVQIQREYEYAVNVLVAQAVEDGRETIQFLREKFSREDFDRFVLTGIYNQALYMFREGQLTLEGIAKMQSIFEGYVQQETFNAMKTRIEEAYIAQLSGAANDGGRVSLSSALFGEIEGRGEEFRHVQLPDNEAQNNPTGTGCRQPR